MPKTSYVYKCFEEAFKALTDKLKPMMHELGFFVMLASSFQASCASQSPDLGKQRRVPCRKSSLTKILTSFECLAPTKNIKTIIISFAMVTNDNNY